MREVRDALEVVSRSADQTRRIGAELGRMAMAGDVFLLVGRLGAGKTCLAQGIAFGLGVQDQVVSPTFVLVRQYEGRIPLYHIDLYRLDRAEEMSDLGLDDYLYGEGASVVEWADKGLALLPREHLFVELVVAGANKRTIRFRPAGIRYVHVVSRIREAVGRLGD